MSEQEIVDRPSEGESDVREQAVQQLKKRRDLSAHFVTYLIFNGAVWGVWALTGAGDIWPAWISGLWAIGLLMNVWDVYGRRPITEAEIRREMERVRGRADSGRPLGRGAVGG
ncbi:MAG TPA: 2TM domain-containing protein [Solirubrobacteraceae bacterium]|nr:2TM domain-containing protein [Solirubrobacteraceae bacterium]